MINEAKKRGRPRKDVAVDNLSEPAPVATLGVPRETTLLPGFKMPDGFSLSKAVVVEYEWRAGSKIITGPPSLRPACLIGMVAP